MLLRTASRMLQKLMKYSPIMRNVRNTTSLVTLLLRMEAQVVLAVA